MAVEVTDLVPFLKANVQPPGTNLFPDALQSDWEINLRNGFWEAALEGLITGYTEEEGIINPVDSDSSDLGRDYQQLIILNASIAIVRNYLMQLNTVFRAKAGPVEFETQQAASVLKAILDGLVHQKTVILERLSEDADASSSYYYDAAIVRNESIIYGDSWWLGA